MNTAGNPLAQLGVTHLEFASALYEFVKARFEDDCARITYDAGWETRRELVHKIRKFYELPSLRKVIPDLVDQILARLDQFPLQPTQS